MLIKSLFVGLRRYLGDFRTANSANITVTFALSTIPVIGAVGAAVDYSHVNSARTAMQAAVDATALMLSKDAGTLTSAQLSTKGTSVFTALYTRPEVKNVLVNSTYSNADGTQVIVSATGTVKSSFVSLIGISQVTIGASSTVKWGNTKLRVALVLDTTGSMNDAGKIGALKTATKNLLTQLKNSATTDGDVYVSIIPFVKDVNAGSSNYNASWIDWTDWDEVNGSCSQWGSNTKSSCIAQGSCSIWGKNSQSSCTSAGTCSISGYYNESDCENTGTCSKWWYTSKTTCTNNAGTWTAGVWTSGSWTPATWTPKSHSTWNGCVVDRGNSSGPSAQNTDTNVIQPTAGQLDTLFAAEQYSSCPKAVMPLSYNWTAMSNLVDSFVAAGNTNQGIGLAHGWMSLVGGGPYPAPPAEDPKYKYTKVIVLMSDGLNTQNRWYSSASQIDARQKILCDNVKAAGITLYTIHVNTDGDPLSTLLQGCASSKDKFWMLTSANQMVDVFKQIGTQLSSLRVAK